jgi:hypothetical protein
MRRKYEFVFRDYNTGRVLGTLALNGKFADALASQQAMYAEAVREGIGELAVQCQCSENSTGVVVAKYELILSAHAALLFVPPTSADGRYGSGARR